MRAELLGEFRLVSAAADRGDLEAHVASVLDPEVAEPADAEHGDEIASLRGELRRALNVVRPAQSSGAALIDESSSGTDMSPLALAINTSA